MSEQSPEVFTIDQVGQVLRTIPLDADRIALVMDGLREQASLRSVEAQEQSQVPQQQTQLEEL